MMMTPTINMSADLLREPVLPSLLDKLEHLDKLVTLAINGLNAGGGGDAFWLFISSNVFTVPFYVLGITLVFLAAGWRRGIIFVLAIALAIGLSDQLCNLVKAFAGRFRPSYDAEMLANGLRVLQGSSKAHCYGFFSAHAALSFALAFGTARVFSWGMYARARRSALKINPLWPALVCWLFFFLWAVVVAVSRIFLAKHFLGDIIVGSICGTLISCAMIYIARYLIIPRVKYFAVQKD